MFDVIPQTLADRPLDVVTVLDNVVGRGVQFKPLLRRLSAEEIRDSFVTLASGNIDSNTNGALEESWDKYVESFNFLMSTNSKQLRELSTALIKSEVQRRALQKEISILRTKAAKARESGDLAAARELSVEIRDTQKQYGKKYQKGQVSNASPTMMKASAAIARRVPQARPDHPEFKMRASELPVPQRGGSFISEFRG